MEDYNNRAQELAGDIDRLPPLETLTTDELRKAARKKALMAEELLLQVITKVDSVETGGSDKVRAQRKATVQRINAILKRLDPYLKSY